MKRLFLVFALSFCIATSSPDEVPVVIESPQVVVIREQIKKGR